MFLGLAPVFRSSYLKIVLLVFIVGVTLILGIKASALYGVQLQAQSGQVTELFSEIQEHIDHDPIDSNLRFLPTRKEYVARFLLDGTPIEAKFQMPFKLANGDKIAVAGYFKGNAFNVLALRNDTEQLTQSNNWKMAIGAGFVFSIIALIILIGLLNNQAMVFPQILLGIFVGVGLFVANFGFLIKEARALL